MLIGVQIQPCTYLYYLLIITLLLLTLVICRLFSYCFTLLYTTTPTITMIVPSPLKRVIEFPNNNIDIHMRNARLTVLATLNHKLY